MSMSILLVMMWNLGRLKKEENTEKDFNRIIEIKREEYRVKLFLNMINQKQKTLVFCATQIHAAAVKDLINQHSESNNPNYCHRVTANDGALGERHLKFRIMRKAFQLFLQLLKKS